VRALADDVKQHEETLKEREAAWWAKQLGHKPGLPGAQASPPIKEATLTVKKAEARPHDLAPQPENAVTGTPGDETHLVVEGLPAQATRLVSQPPTQTFPATPTVLRRSGGADQAVDFPAQRVLVGAAGRDASVGENVAAQRHMLPGPEEPVEHRKLLTILFAATQRLAYQLDELRYSPYDPYPWVRQACGYLLLSLFAAAIGWLLAAGPAA
jgi:hypothetical protein